MSDKYLLFSLDDDKAKSLGEVISNPTCKKIVNLLAEKELSESDISKELKMPVNTVEYNLKKLLDAGIIEKSKHWWSVKGKKIDTYKVANKLIVISPKKSIASKLMNIIPVVFIIGIITGMIGWFTRNENIAEKAIPMASESGGVLSTGSSAAADSARNFAQTIAGSPTWEWFLIGSLTAVVVFMILNWKKL